MPRREINNDGKVDQLSPISTDDPGAKRTVVEADASILEDKQQMERLAFNEEPVMIMIQPSSDKSGAMLAPCWVNGEPAMIFSGTMEEAFDEKAAYDPRDGRWFHAPMGHLPCSRSVITKRKFVETLLRSKIDTIKTVVGDTSMERPHNLIDRRTAPAHAISVQRDDNPRSAAWQAELQRRYY